MEYNTSREDVKLPEYGRNVEKMIQHALSLEDRAQRNLAAEEIIRVMGQLNPQLRDIAEYTHILWDHLFIMSEFKLDVSVRTQFRMLNLRRNDRNALLILTET